MGDIPVKHLENGGEVKKFHVALFVDELEKKGYVQIQKSTDNTITMNAETLDRDFIVDESPTTILSKYKPSLSEPLTLVKGEADYDFFWKKFYGMATGSSAKGTLLIVFYNDETSDGKFKAWEGEVLFVLDNFNPTESVLTVNINMNGTVKKGLATITGGTVTFTEQASAGTGGNAGI